MDAEGNLFGTTVGGPENGIVFELSPVSGGWTERKIYEYAGVSGDDFGPTSNLAIDKSGNLFWSTPDGGVGDCGFVYELVRESASGWSGKVIHTFAGAPADGCSARGGFVIDSHGDLFGTAYGGGKSSMGTVFQLSPKGDGSWTETTLWNFTGNFSDGQYPQGTLVLDASDNIYGTTETGGKGGAGTVYEVKPSGTSSTETVLYSFGTNPTDGDAPQAGLIFDKAGNLYGTTTTGTGLAEGGMVFELLPGSSGEWNEKILHSFVLGTPDGNQPEGSLVFDAKGNLYGTTVLGGAYASGSPGYGTIFQLIPMPNGTWSERILHSFNTPNKDGEEPECNLIFGPNGSLYGTTRDSGIFQNGVLPEGTVFEFANPDRTATPSFTPPGGIYSSTQTVHIADSFFGASIYYTTNGDTPDSSSTRYTGPFKVSASETVKAIAFGAGDSPSPVASGSYKIESQAAAPKFSIKAGTYHAVQHLTFTDATADASIYFTINGTTPTTTSRKYAGPISISETEVVKAIAIATGKSSSPVTSAAYVIQIPVTAKPVFSPQAGAYSAGQRVTITCATAGAVIYYTTGAKPPTTASPKFPAAGIVLNKSVTIQAIAMAPGHTDSAVATAAYTVQ